MVRLAFILLLAPLLSGCWIYTNLQGNGSVASVPPGKFDCTNNTGDCREEYTGPGTETLVAEAGPGYTFARWTGCTHTSIDTCQTVPWNQGMADGDGIITVTATFREQTPPVHAARYTYNALGQRMTKTVSGKTTIFQYGLDGSLMAEIDAATGQPLRQHIYVNGEPVAQLSTKPGSGEISVHYVHVDHLGTPTLLTNQAGNVVADIEATPFGEAYIDYAEVAHNRRFPGQYKDEETGLHYNYFRDYDPSVGRYIQSDPRGVILDFSDPRRHIAAEMGLRIPDLAYVKGLNHLYGYVDQNPLLNSDLTGEIYVALATFHYFDIGDYFTTHEGNRSGGLSPIAQDFACSSVAQPLNSSNRAKKCCAQHDQCYINNNCNQSSWIGNILGGTKACNACNSAVVRDIVGL